jgi:hypothetical protein
MVGRLWSWIGSATAARPSLAVAAVALLWAVVETWPVAAHIGDTIYGFPGDATGSVALYWWWEYAARHGQSLFVNSLQGVPLGSGWENIPFNALPMVVLTPLAIVFGPIVAYNLEILSSFPLTAWLTYLLARRLEMRPLSAAFAALAFAAVPLHIQKAMGHAGQTHMELFPAALLFLVRWRQGGSRWNLVAAGAMGGLELWIDFYFTAILMLLVAVFFLVSAIFRAERWHTVPTQLRAHLAAAGIILVTAAAFVPVAVIFAHRPTSAGYVQSAQSAALPLVRSLGELEEFSARVQFYLMPPHDNPLVPDAVLQWEIAHLHGNNFIEAALFVGYTILVLAVLGVLARRFQFPVLLLVAVGVAGFVFSLPPNYAVPLIKLHAPSYYLYAFVPYIRVYSRFGVLVLLGSALLAGMGYAVLQQRARSWLRPLALVGPFLLVAVEFNNLPPSHTTAILPAPAEYSWLQSQPSGVLIEYPLHGPMPVKQEIETRQYTLYQSVHEHPMFNTAVTVGPAADFAPRLEPYYGTSVVQQLRSLGIRYVFVHRRDYVADGWSLPQTVSGLTYVRTLADTDIYLVDGQ